jgi:hypothetical protein
VRFITAIICSYFEQDSSIFVGKVANENTAASLVFSSAFEPTKQMTIIFIGLGGRQKPSHFRRPPWPMKIVLLFSLAALADENVNIFSSAFLADENRVIFVGCRRKRSYFYLLYSVGLISSVGRRK